MENNQSTSKRWTFKYSGLFRIYIFFLTSKSWITIAIDSFFMDYQRLTIFCWLVVSDIFLFSIIYGIIPLTNSYFSRWLLHHQPVNHYNTIINHYNTIINHYNTIINHYNTIINHYNTIIIIINHYQPLTIDHLFGCFHHGTSFWDVACPAVTTAPLGSLCVPPMDWTGTPRSRVQTDEGPTKIRPGEIM